MSGRDGAAPQPEEAQGHVLIVEDDPTLRRAVAGLLRSIGLECTGYESAQDALAAAPPPGPCAFVVDIRLPRMGGLEFQRRLAEAGRPASIVFMTGHGDIQMSVSAMKAGAVDFLTKPFRDQDMIDAVIEALERDRARRARAAETGALRARWESLTGREREVLDGVSRGLMNKQIAGELGLAEITVKLHRSSLMRKMGLRSAAELALAVRRLAEADAG